MKRITPQTLLMICLAGMLLLHWLLPIRVILTPPLNWLGLLPLILGIAINLAGSNRFTAVGTNIQPYNEPGTLVTDGIYKYTRNAMYLGGLVTLVGVWLLLGSLSPLIPVLLIFVVLDRWNIPFEERWLTEKFGPAYAAYKQRTRRWL